MIPHKKSQNILFFVLLNFETQRRAALLFLPLHPQYLYSAEMQSKGVNARQCLTTYTASKNSHILLMCVYNIYTISITRDENVTKSFINYLEAHKATQSKIVNVRMT